MQLRCKSQKDAGKVWFRVITGTSKYMYRSLAECVAAEIGSTLESLGDDHLVLSEVDFAKRLQRAQYLSTAVFVKLDLTDFYLEGLHDVIMAELRKRSGRSGKEVAFLEAVELLLSEQYTRCDELDPSNKLVHQIVKGVGQGLPHAGDLADLIWFLVVESGWAVHHGIQKEHSILDYFRFRDDMVIIADGAYMDQVHTYLNGIIERAGTVGYEVKVEHIGLDVPFLNVRVGINKLKSKYTTSLYTKPSDINNVPVDPRSGQPWHAHKVWPKAQLKVAARIDGNIGTAATRMVNKFHAHCLPAPPVAHQVLDGLEVGTATAKKPESSQETIWVPLPYHPLTASKISRKLSELSQDADNKARFKACFKREMPILRAAWTNANVHLERRIRRSCSQRKLTLFSALDPRKEAGDSSLQNAAVTEEAPVVVANIADTSVAVDVNMAESRVFPKAAVRHRKRIRDFVYPDRS